MTKKIGNMQSSRGEAVAQLETELLSLRDENGLLKKQIATLQEQLSYEKEKFSSLEQTLQNLTAGKEEMIAREKAAAEERAQHNRAREEQFNIQLQSSEAQAKEREMKLKSEFSHSKNEWVRKEQELCSNFDSIRKGKDKEIEGLRK
jgi:predicted  nucleic acid-binding Zn-ribbon protein